MEVDMPLIKSGGKEALGKNISELKGSGRPKTQAVAIGLSHQRDMKAKGFNKGGSVQREGYTPSVESAMAQNLAETAANPTGDIGLNKGGQVKGGGWKRWGKK
jgi:hypothetical protein